MASPYRVGYQDGIDHESRRIPMGVLEQRPSGRANDNKGPTMRREDGPTGDIRFGQELCSFRSRGQVVRDFVIAAILGPTIVALLTWIARPEVTTAAALVGAFVLYCTLSFYVRARPKALRYRLFTIQDNLYDRVDQALGVLAVAFGLGRFLSVSLADGLRYFRTGELPGDRLVDSLDDRP
jgi:hypothetical protein